MRKRFFIKPIIKYFVFFILLLYIMYSIGVVNLVQSITRSNYHEKPSKQLLCIITTAPSYIDNRVVIVHNAWAKHCDKHFFVTVVNPNVKNASVEQMTNNGIPFLQPKYFTDERYRQLSDKMFKTIIHLYEQHSSYDWYLKADDDTFVFVDNLRDFLSTKDPMKPVTYGYTFKVKRNITYQSGGAAYVWSKEALKRIGRPLSKNFNFCKKTGSEDFDVGQCFHKVGVRPSSSIDELGRERFHPMDIRQAIIGVFPHWFHDYSVSKPTKGLNCCSETSISFHYESEEDIERLGYLANILAKKRKHKNISIFNILFQFMELSKLIIRAPRT